MLVDDSGTIIDVNPAFVFLFCDKKDALIGKSSENVFTGIIPENAISTLLNADTKTTKITLRHHEKPKSFYVNRISSHVKNGQTFHFIIFNEKAETAKLENRINSLENDLQKEKGVSVVGHLTPGIVHNINNPLAVIIGRSQLLSMKHPEIPNLISIQEQAGLIKSILDPLSFKISHELQDIKTPINIGDLLRYELAVLSADPFYKHKVQKQICLENSTPLISGLYSDFSTALLTVINYSLDSLLSAPKKIFNISTRVDSEYIVVSISDSGSMAKTEKQDRDFPLPPIYQSSRMGKQIINMNRVCELIAKYDGKIKMTKNNPAGKEFQIRIPY